MTFSSASISAPQAIKKSLKSLFPSFPVMDAKASLRGLKVWHVCIHHIEDTRAVCPNCSAERRWSWREEEGGDLSDTICFGSAR